MKILIPFLLRWERTRVPICRSVNFRTKKFQIQRSRWGFTLSNWGEVQSPIFRVTTFRSSSHLSSSIQLQQTPQIILHLRQQKQIHYPAIYKANMSMYTYTGVRVCVYLSQFQAIFQIRSSFRDQLQSDQEIWKISTFCDVFREKEFISVFSTRYFLCSTFSAFRERKKASARKRGLLKKAWLRVTFSQCTQEFCNKRTHAPMKF